MKTTYLKSLSSTLCPFSPHATTARLILSLLPPTTRTRIAVKTKLLSRAAGADEPATLKMEFTDGAVMEWAWMARKQKKERRRRRRELDSETGGKRKEGKEKEEEEEATVKDIVEQVERHYRGLSRKQELAG